MTGSLAGTYEVDLVATSGERAKASVRGTLVLEPQDAQYRDVMRVGTRVEGASVPLRGTLDVSLDSIGAIRLGDPMSTDPRRPGVAVIEQTGTSPTITIRVGAESNEYGVARFDGAYTVLRIAVAREDGSFAGSWTSGTAQPVAGGHFCAVRRG